MPACPDGHESSATDFCDVCGIRIGTSGSASAPGTGSAPSGSTALPPLDPATAGEPCPQCGTGRDGQFCEVCGYDFTAGRPALSLGTPAAPEAPAAPGAAALTVPREALLPDAPAASGTRAAAPGAGWTAVVAADRAYFDSVISAGGPDAASIQFPGYCPERRFPLAGPEMRIGRRSTSRGLAPEIDLTGPPTDPGISHLHAVLIAQPDGTWSVLDPGSANGTQVNDIDIADNVRVPLKDGDRICLGAWTVLTIRTA
jgi:hypothetical protein